MKKSAKLVTAVIRAAAGTAGKLAGVIGARAASNRQAFPRVANALRLAAESKLEPAKLNRLLAATNTIIQAITPSIAPAMSARPAATPTASAPGMAPGGNGNTKQRPPKKKK